MARVRLDEILLVSIERSVSILSFRHCNFVPTKTDIIIKL